MFIASGDDNDRLPRGLVAIVLLACILPILLRRVAGVHFIPAGADGSLIHSLLEWSAVCASLFTAFLGFLYLRVRADYLVLTIRVVRDDGRMRLSVQDDCSGLDSDADGDGMGLHIMRYRARMIDATLEIRPAPDKGTGLTCEWSS